jgi:hypothetical protein
LIINKKANCNKKEERRGKGEDNNTSTYAREKSKNNIKESNK